MENHIKTDDMGVPLFEEMMVVIVLIVMITMVYDDRWMIWIIHIWSMGIESWSIFTLII